MLRSSFAGFSSALSAMQSNQKNLSICGQNIANINTKGYTRQKLNMSSLNYDHPQSFYLNENDVNIGFGVSSDKISQMRNQFVDSEYRTQNSNLNYEKSISESMDALSAFLDESSIVGIKQSFDDIRSSLTNMQDPSKVNDPVYEGEFRSRMNQLCNFLNYASRQLDQTENAEYEKLDGRGCSESGCVEKVNSLLKDIGKLNNIIKRNEIMSSPSLELKDKRNLLIDELSEYIPIKVSYYKDEEHKTEKAWPDDLRIDMVYEDENSMVNTITLVDGTHFSKRDGETEPVNYGKLTIGNVDTGKFKENINRTDLKNSSDKNSDSGIPFLNTAIKYEAPPNIIGNTTTANITKAVIIAARLNGHDSITNDTSSDAKNEYGNTQDVKTGRTNSGKIQASIDMLSVKRHGVKRNIYDYRKDIDSLARVFAETTNEINKKGTKDHDKNPFCLLNIRNSETELSSYDDLNASNISVSSKWSSNQVHVGTYGEFDKDNNPEGGSSTDTVLNLLDNILKPHEKLNNQNFSTRMNSISTQLANDNYTAKYHFESDKNVLKAVQSDRDELSGVSLDEEATNMMQYVSSYNAAARLMTALDETLDTLVSRTGLVGR